MLRATILFAVGMCANLFSSACRRWRKRRRSHADAHRLRHRRARRRTSAALLRHLRVQGPEAGVHVQLLPDQARRRLHGVGHRLRARRRTRTRRRRVWWITWRSSRSRPSRSSTSASATTTATIPANCAPFPGATLLIGKGDWDGITAPTPMQGVNAAPSRSWIAEGRQGRTAAIDKDVFGDGTRARSQHAGPHAGPSAACWSG